MKSKILKATGLIILLSLTIISVQVLFASPTDNVEGCWRNIDDKTKKIKSKICLWIDDNNKLHGYIKELYNPKVPNPLCKKCPGKDKNKPVIGLVIVWNMRKGSDAWTGGSILDPENGKTYDCKIWREGDKLKVRGYIAFFFRTQTWIK
ncbi:MAG: DUF2147 domain-containing protein [Spirochaetota bacterium]|nr:DUF2147 domain-containing protein [Spirochaetota bacterium]